MHIPKFYSFSSSMCSKVSEKTGSELAECEVHVFRNEDVAWSIVLSYFMHLRSKNSAPEEFHRGVSLLMDCNEDFSKIVKKSIFRFNPFQNRYSCFYDECLKIVVSNFAKRLEGSLSLRRKLQAASDLLQCSIVKLTTPDALDPVFIFPQVKESTKHNVTLFQSDKKPSQFSFGIEKDLGLKLQKVAFITALKHAEIPWKDGRRLHEKVNEKEPFITTLFKSECKSYIPQLYKSSYALHRLAEAGFVTDPTKEDENGYAALFHALSNNGRFYNNHFIIYSMFLHACGTFREPDSSVISGLKKMNGVLCNMQKKLDACELPIKTKNQIHSKIEELSLLNKFLKIMSSGILNIKNSCALGSQDFLEASKRKDIIMCILNTYEKISCEVSANVSLDDYKQKKVFYQTIDSISAMMFFDNIFLLKERLKMEDMYLYSAIESFFYLTVWFNGMTFPHCKALYGRKFEQDIDECFDLVSAFQRTAIKEHIINFRKKLQETNIEDKNILKCVPKDEIFRTFHAFEEIKDEILIHNLKFYLNAALKVKVNSIKSVLVIERALQVIGEDVVFSNQPYSMRRLLALSIPSEQLKILMELRSKISHLSKKSFSLKLDTEKNFSFFRDIREEISKINSAFSPIIDLQHFRATKRAIMFMAKLIAETQQNKTRNALFLETHLEKLSDYWNKIINTSNTMWEKKLQCCVKRHLEKYKIVFENTFEYMEQTLLNDNFWKSDKSDPDFVAKVKEVTWPVKFMLTIFKESTTFHINNNLMEMCENVWMSQDCSTESEAKTKVKQLLSMAKTFASFLDLPNTEEHERQFSIAKIHEFKLTLEGSTFLSEEEKSKIKSEIPQLVLVARQTVLESIETGNLIKQEERDEYFNSLIVSKKKRKALKKKYHTDSEKAKSIVESSCDPVEALEQMFSANRHEKKKFDILCDTVHFSKESKSLFSQIFCCDKKPHLPGNNLSETLDRVCTLKNILIEESNEIRILWNAAKSKTAKDYAVYKITQRFMQDPQVRAAAEMLLYDCMLLMKADCKEYKEEMRIKTSKLYKGVNLRNALAHGSPMLENVALLLDVEDVPSAYVMKMLKLIEDEPVIIRILKSGLDSGSFEKMMNSSSKEDDELRSRVGKCESWKLYSKLLPEKQISQSPGE